MRKSSRLIPGMMCILTSALLLAGCGSGSSSSEVKNVVEVGTDSTEAGTGMSDSATDSSISEDADSAETVENMEDSSVGITIEEQTLLEQDGIKVTATEYIEDSIWGEGIKLLLENESDKDVSVSCNALIVNNYMVSNMFVSTVAAGKKSNETLYLSSSELKAAGIENVGQVEIYFHVYDPESYDSVFDSDCVTIQTSAYDEMDTSSDDSGTELYNSDGIRIVGKTVDEDSFWGTAILLYCENNSGKNISVSVEDMSINGYMMTPFFTSTIYDGKKAYDDITIMSSELEENGITAVKEVELQFHIYDEETYDTIADSEPITFAAQ